MKKISQNSVAIAEGVAYSPDLIGRVGGNAPTIIESSNLLEGSTYFASLVHPTKNGFVLSIFIPKSYEELIYNRVYPDTTIKVIEHEISAEGQSDEFKNPDLNKISISDYVLMSEEKYHGSLVKVGGTPVLIQDEDYYFTNLKKDGYSFLLQIDEDYYPKNLLAGSYPFCYGALYLFCKWQSDHVTDVIAGFAQWS